MPVSVTDISDQLRSAVVEGRLRPGSRLPQRQELSRTLGASLATVQEAVTILREEGFLEVGARKNGTRVSLRPPHQFRYKLVFPSKPPFAGTFFRHLHDEAERSSGGRVDFSSFYGLNDRENPRAYRQIVEDVRNQRIAGLIFASSADEYKETELLTFPGLPRAAVASSYQLPGVPKVAMDYEDFYRRALEHLASAGRKRPGFLLNSGALEPHAYLGDAHRDAMRQRGWDINPLWEQGIDYHAPTASRNITRLMFHAGQHERPDALIVSDDNCLPHVMTGLKQAGVTCGRDVEVVALANFPLEANVTDYPVTHLGFDIPDVLHRLTDLIARQRRCDSVPPLQNLPALLHREYLEQSSITGKPSV